MAVLAVADVLRVRDVVIALNAASVETIVCSANDAGEVDPVMDLVRHDGHVDRIAAAGVRRARVVAGHAVLHLESRATVER